MEPKFKLGDRIMIVKSGWDFKKGLFGTVTHLVDTKPQAYVIAIDNLDHSNYYYEDALEFGTEAARLLYV